MLIRIFKHLVTCSDAESRYFFTIHLLKIAQRDRLCQTDFNALTPSDVSNIRLFLATGEFVEPICYDGHAKMTILFP